MKKIIVFILAVLLIVVSYSHDLFARNPIDKRFTRNYSNGRVIDKNKFRHIYPGFEFYIPKECKGWKMTPGKKVSEPLLITKGGKSPVISLNIDFYDELPKEKQELWSDPDKLFEMRILDDQVLEMSLFPDMLFLFEKRTDIAGLPGYTRIMQSRNSGLTYNIVYILFPDAIVQFTLNSTTKTFQKNDADLLAIINTFKRFE